MGKTLEYIGPKQDGERHMQRETGIEWMPGARHAVSDQHAEEFLKHPTSWRECAVAPAAPAALASKPGPAPLKDLEGTDAQLPDWAKKGIELGASDDQLEAIAQAGGPHTEQGAVLWKDFTGAEWEESGTKTEAKPPATKPPAAKKTKATTAAKRAARKAK